MRLMNFHRNDFTRRCAIDTNVLLRQAQKEHKHSPVASQALQTLTQQNVLLCLMPQTIYEFWTVVTRPSTARGGFGWTTQQAFNEVEKLEEAYTIFIPTRTTIYREWKRLVSTYNVSGVASHDAHLIAAMKINRVEEILTFNTKDFIRYSSENIRVLDPSQIAAERTKLSDT